MHLACGQFSVGGPRPDPTHTVNAHTVL